MKKLRLRLSFYPSHVIFLCHSGIKVMLLSLFAKMKIDTQTAVKNIIYKWFVLFVTDLLTLSYSRLSKKLDYLDVTLQTFKCLAPWRSQQRSGSAG